MITIKDILKHPKYNLSRLIPPVVNKSIKGRVGGVISHHMLYVLKAMMGDFCKTYLEIGVMHGGSLIVTMQEEHPATFVGVDLFKGFYGMDNDPYTGIEVSLEVVEENINNNNPHKHPFKLIKGSSHTKKTFAQVKEACPVVDLLFIDGNHSKTGVIKDFKLYSQLLRKKSIVVFDNYRDRRWPGVSRAIKELDFSGYGIIGEYFPEQHKTKGAGFFIIQRKID